MHLLPYAAFALRAPLDPAPAANEPDLLLLQEGGGTTRWNLDGVLAVPWRCDAGYAQLFRNGVYEAVDARTILDVHEEEGRASAADTWSAC